MLFIIRILIKVAMLAVCAITFYIIWTTLNKLYGKKSEVFNKINEMYARTGRMDYKKTELSRIGVMYRVKNYDLTPGYFMVLKIAVGIMISILSYAVATTLLEESNILIIPAAFIVGYIAVPAYFKYENGVDNKEMLMDIYNTYSNIKIQLAAGIYIRECLEYTYDMIKSERYKEALAELILNFSDKTISSTEAVNIFKNRFQSHEIDKLSALLGSFMQYGMNANHADDIMLEIQGIIQADTLKAEHDIESKAGMVTFAFFAVIIMMVVSTVVTSFSMNGIF